MELGFALMAPFFIIIVGAVVFSWMKRRRRPTSYAEGETTLAPEDRARRDRCSIAVLPTGSKADFEADEKPPPDYDSRFE